MIPRAALQVRAREWGLTEEVVEKDYVLGWLLWGVGSRPALRDHWVFKGGTCLKKCFVETYRFSEDLDFTVLDDGPLEPDDLLPVLTEMLDLVEQETGITLSSRPPAIRLRPDGRSAEGRIYYRGPRDAPGEARVKLDLTYDETVVETPVLERKCGHKNVPVPTLAAVTATEKAADLRADRGAMLAHQLPVLPPVDEFIDALEDVFAWLGGEEPVQPGPTPAAGEEIDASWVVPSTLTRWPGGAPLGQIRFAGANHLLVELDYQASTRLIDHTPCAAPRLETSSSTQSRLRQEKSGPTESTASKAFTSPTPPSRPATPSNCR
ncbi:MAG: nucleotidyl transferase AbiEii/AbiGii toxin family protein [Solirubrobacterales bacterium]